MELEIDIIINNKTLYIVFISQSTFELNEVLDLCTVKFNALPIEDIQRANYFSYNYDSNQVSCISNDKILFTKQQVIKNMITFWEPYRKFNIINGQTINLHSDNVEFTKINMWQASNPNQNYIYVNPNNNIQTEITPNDITNILQLVSKQATYVAKIQSYHTAQINALTTLNAVNQYNYKIDNNNQPPVLPTDYSLSSH
jgi:hypothetical protein